MTGRPPVVRREANDAQVGRRRDGGLGHFIATLLFALLFSIVFEWVGMNLWWPDEGAEHSERTLAAELRHLNSDFKETVLRTSSAEWVRELTEAVHRFFRGVWSKLCAVLPCKHWFADFHEYVEALINVTKAFFVRLAVLALSAPAFALFGLVGFVEGLMRRDLRRWGGGRESSFVYHHSKRLLGPLILSAWTLYLSSPVTLHPNLVLVPFAALFGVAVAVTTGTFKKHL